MERLTFALERIRFTRVYTSSLLKDVNPEQWFRQPVAGTTHIAWQVGHLAAAQYAMALRAIRGERPNDGDLLPVGYRSLFGRGSTVEAEAAKYPSPEELWTTLDRVHQRVGDELAGVADATLDEPPTNPHPAFKTKFGALVFCAEHEMVHAGQIGLLRRLLGYAPVR